MSSPNSVFERNVLRICAKLRAIAQLDFGDKWNSTTKQAESDTPVNKLLRTVWYWKEGKDNSVIDFKIIFEEAYTIAFELLNLYPLSDATYQVQLALWIRDLTEQVADTKMAMIRQKGTYSKYTKTQNDLDEILKYINKMSDQVAIGVKQANVVLTNPTTIESISPHRLNPVHIPYAVKKEVKSISVSPKTSEDLIPIPTNEVKKEAKPINIEIGSAEEYGNTFDEDEVF